jgi:hypothetical protein
MAKADSSSAPPNAHPLIKRVIDDKPPIAKLIGFEVVEISHGRAVAVFEAGPQHANPMGRKLIQRVSFCEASNRNSAEGGAEEKRIKTGSGASALWEV